MVRPSQLFSYHKLWHTEDFLTIDGSKDSGATQVFLLHHLIIHILGPRHCILLHPLSVANEHLERVKKAQYEGDLKSRNDWTLFIHPSIH